MLRSFLKLRGLQCWLCAVLVLALTSLGAFAETAGEYQSRARHAVLMDAASGAVLFQKHADELVPPASISKLMTLAVLFKTLKSGKLKPSDEFVMSVNAWRKGGAPSRTAAMMVPVNQRAKVEELIQGIVVQSGNDACISVAEGIAGTEDNFAKLMTQEARRIGLKKSTFGNATGLYHADQLMSAREIAQLARHIIKEYPEYYQVFGQKEFQYRKHKFINRNPLLFLSIGADGMKTGFIKESGYGMVASAVQEGRRLIAVVMGHNSADERKIEAQRILEWGFRNAGEFKLFDEGEVVGQARVWGGDSMYVPLVGKGELKVVLPKVPVNPKLKAEIVYKYPLKAPITKGDEVALLRITTPTGAQNDLPLYASEDVAVGGVMRRGLDTIVHLAFRWITL